MTDRQQTREANGDVYECPVCEFTVSVGAPTQNGVAGTVGTTKLGRVTHSGCGVAWPLRSTVGVLEHDPKPKRRRWWRVQVTWMRSDRGEGRMVGMSTNENTRQVEPECSSPKCLFGSNPEKWCDTCPSWFAYRQGERAATERIVARAKELSNRYSTFEHSSYRMGKADALREFAASIEGEVGL